MKNPLAGYCCVAVLATFLQAGEPARPDWLEKMSAPQTGTFPLPAERELSYSAGWAGMVAGRVKITFSNDKQQQTLRASGRTIDLARTLYPLDVDFSARCDPASLLPKETRIVEQYRDEKRTTVQRFSASQLTRQRSTEPPEKDDGKTKTVLLPHVLDLQSSLLYIRSQPLAVGDQIIFLTYATGSPYVAKVSVVSKERIRVPAGEYSALKLHLDLTSIDKKLGLKPYRRARNITAWISDDSERRFLKFTADLLIGRVFIQLDKSISNGP